MSDIRHLSSSVSAKRRFDLAAVIRTAPAWVPVLGLLVPVLLSGCFSAVSRMGAGWGGPEPSTGARVAAGVADVATLPLQAPLLVVAGVGAAGQKAAIETRKKRVNEIRQDPEIIFLKNWHRRADGDGRDAVEFALWDHAIAFTDQQLRRLYREMREGRHYVVGNPHCSVEFLRTVWDAMVQKGMYSDWQTREQLLRNPTTPIEWLEQAAAFDKSTGGMDHLAAAMIEKRKRAAPATSAPAGDGKR